MGYREAAYVCDFDFDVEIEEREEQVYKVESESGEGSGGSILAPNYRLAPVIKTFEPGAHNIDMAHAVLVKLKRYYYRLRVTVMKTYLAVGGVNEVGIKQDAGAKKGAMSFNIVGDNGVKYICTREHATLVRSEVNLWRATQIYEGFGPWKKVPASWGLDQATDDEDEESDSDSDSGSGS